MQPYTKVLENTQVEDIGTCNCPQGSRGPPRRGEQQGVGCRTTPCLGGSRAFSETVCLQGVLKGGQL